MSLEIMTSIDLNENSISGIPDNVQTVGGKKMHALDSALSETSANPVQNRAIKMKFDLIDGEINDVNDRIDNLDLDVSVDNVTIKKGDNDTLFGTGAGYYSNDALKGEVFNLVDSQTSNVASGSYSHAEGSSTTASGDNSHTEGYSTEATKFCAHAEGSSGVAFGWCSHVEGVSTTKYNSQTMGTDRVALFNRFATKPSLVAFGNQSHAEGEDCAALSDYAHAEGCGTRTLGQYSHVEGFKTSISSTSAIAAHAEGSESSASAEATHAEGYHTTASGNYSHSEGEYTNATGEGAHAEGSYTLASGSASHSEGSNTRATGNHSHAEGEHTNASDSGAHAEGEHTTASKPGAHAEGTYCQAVASYAHAEGYYTLASGEGSHAEGHGGQSRGAIGKYSHIEGYDNLAVGDASHSEGRDNQIASPTATYSHAEGNGNLITTASESHVEGYKNKINGPGSAYHVEGYMNTYTPGSAASSGIYGTGAHLSGIYNTLRDGFGGTNMCGTLNTTGAVWTKSSFVAGIANRINNVSCAIGCGLMAQDHCVVVGNRNYAPSTGGINTSAVLEYTGSTDLNSLYDANCAVIMKSSGTVSELIICIADADSNLTKSNIIGVNVNGTVVDPQYYSLTDDISNRSGFTNTPFDLSKIHSYYLIINAQGFTSDPNDEYTIEVSESHVLGDRYIFSVGNGMFAKDEDCHDNHRANALAVTYNGNAEVQNNITFKYVDSSNVKHRISLQKVVDALLALNVSITDLEV
jgi:hypothetical protein